jgi:uncharacterized protein YoaH (UPF0181 family)
MADDGYVANRPEQRAPFEQAHCCHDEHYRSMAERLAHEQAALRRVATLVARGAETGEVFAAVAREVAEVMHLPVAAVQRYNEDGGTMTILAAWGDRPHPFYPGTRWSLHRTGLARERGPGPCPWHPAQSRYLRRGEA